MIDLEERDVAVIIAAGGGGTRMAAATGGVRKQFVVLGDAPVFVQSVKRFARLRAIGQIVLVMPIEALTDAESALKTHGLSNRVDIVTGGETRQASVANGLQALRADVDHVLVHDAVRPFVSAAQISAVVAATRRLGASSLCLPVADTLRRTDGGSIGAWVDREDLWRMQTPQGARLDWLRRAHLVASDTQSTDEVGLLQAAGYSVGIVEGDEWNRKLTRPEDLELARVLWPVWEEKQRSAP